MRPRRFEVVERLDAEGAGDIHWRVGPAERDEECSVLGLPGLIQATVELREQIAILRESFRRPLVLGGDCSLLLGVGAALQRYVQRPGLWFIDGHTDTFDTASSPTGEAADMELAGLTAHGPRCPTIIARGDPIIAPQSVVVLGHRHRDDLDDDRELDFIDPAITRIDARALRAHGAAAAATRAERALRACDGVWLHLDLDVLDQEALPAVSCPQPGGLSWYELVELFAPLIASERLAGMTVADLQAELDPDLGYAQAVVDLLAAHLV